MIDCLGHSNAGSVRKRAAAMMQIVGDSLADHQALATGTGAEKWLSESDYLFLYNDRAHFEDEWRGHFGTIPFSVHEAKLEESRGSGKNTRWVTVFHGLVMSIGYSKRFLGTTILVKDNAYRKFWGGKSDSVKVNGMQLDYADMTHPDFEDRFDIYTSDQVEARDLIDPLYVERLIAVEKSYHGDDVATIFHEGSLVVTLKTGNMFESGSIEASDDRKKIEQTVDQFMRLSDLAKELNSREARTGV